jgi:hypothetical protein
MVNELHSIFHLFTHTNTENARTLQKLMIIVN